MTDLVRCLHPLVAEPTFQPMTEDRHALHVRQLACRVPEVELSQVAAQVFFADVVVRTVDRSLQLREEVLGHVGRHIPSHVLALGVIHRLVREPFRGERLVRTGLIGHQVTGGNVGVLRDRLAEGLACDICDHRRSGLASLGVDEAQNRGLVRVLIGANRAWLEHFGFGLRLVVVIVLRISTDPRFVGNQQTDHRVRTMVRHGVANPVQHVPRATGAHPVAALDLAGTDPVLRCAHVEDDQHPRPHRNLGGVHDRPRQYRELPFALPALPHPPLAHLACGRLAAHSVRWRDQVHVRSIAVGTDRSTAPPHPFKVPVSVGLGDDLLAQRGDGDPCVHRVIVAKGCDN